MVDSEPSSSASSTPASPVASERRRFDVVLRGYERHSVDQYLAQQDEQLAKMRHDLAESERRRALAEQHATATENEIRTLRSDAQYSERTPPEESFGYRAEKLLRLAEQEAAEVLVHRVPLVPAQHDVEPAALGRRGSAAGGTGPLSRDRGRAGRRIGINHGGILAIDTLFALRHRGWRTAGGTTQSMYPHERR